MGVGNKCIKRHPAELTVHLLSKTPKPKFSHRWRRRPPTPYLPSPTSHPPPTHSHSSTPPRRLPTSPTPQSTHPPPHPTPLGAGRCRTHLPTAAFLKIGHTAKTLQLSSPLRDPSRASGRWCCPSPRPNTGAIGGLNPCPWSSWLVARPEIGSPPLDPSRSGAPPVNPPAPAAGPPPVTPSPADLLSPGLLPSRSRPQLDFPSHEGVSPARRRAISALALQIRRWRLACGLSYSGPGGAIPTQQKVLSPTPRRLSHLFLGFGHPFRLSGQTFRPRATHCRLSSQIFRPRAILS
uniref:Uncharacterized protein n=1 Tax=Kalanchoe fedtschenkoi TaxID=63787 RepID=A0A7N0TQE2_KALFE